MTPVWGSRVGGRVRGATYAAPMSTPFVPDRRAGLDALDAFVPHAGRRYAELRNHDFGPQSRANVSMLSPYLRHRLITEREVIEAVLDVHSPQSAEKFVQEVFWRTYWKGWLELRPALWRRYRNDVSTLVEQRDTAPWSDDLTVALSGATGIDCFDAWVAELSTNGYLHNHTRMWFASIWIFTLRLPWQLGADLFYRQLIDGDAASNTLSWRWVAGLQTAGKTYLATAHNIATYTEGRFSPRGLATQAVALEEDHLPDPSSLEDAISPSPLSSGPIGRVGLLLHDDDLHAESLDLARVDRGGPNIVSVAGGHVTSARSPLAISPSVLSFANGAMTDSISRAAAHYGEVTRPLTSEILSDLSADTVQRWAQSQGLSTIITPYAPVGPAGEAITELVRELDSRGVTVATVRREWDTAAWPHARRGFFPFRERIPKLLSAAGLGRH